jgi:hypothetical protein
VVDLGCGQGQYGRYFRRHAPSVEWLGVDGAEGVEFATGGFVRFADLSNGLPSSLQVCRTRSAACAIVPCALI